MPQLTGKEVGPIGYGMMGLTWAHTKPDGKLPPIEQSYDAMKAALEGGANFWNGGELYGTPENNSLHLLRDYFEKYPEQSDKIIISIKGGFIPGQLAPDGSEKNVKRSIDECLRVLDGKKKLDLFECARVDPKTPIEITIRAMMPYIKQGKLGGISLSECSAETIRRASKVHKISAVEVEFSLWATEILENGIAKACAELDIPIVAYCPLGRGFLTGQFRKPEDMPKDDPRHHYPRYQGENFAKNIQLVEEIEKIAKRKGVTPGQIGIAWVIAQGAKPGNPTFIPIPGASHAKRVKENVVEVKLSTQELDEIDAILKKVPVSGGRYPAAGSALLEGDSPPLKE